MTRRSVFANDLGQAEDLGCIGANGRPHQLTTFAHLPVDRSGRETPDLAFGRFGEWISLKL